MTLNENGKVRQSTCDLKSKLECQQHVVNTLLKRYQEIYGNAPPNVPEQFL